MSNFFSYLRKPLLFLDKRKDNLNFFLPFYLLSYFILIFLPYIVADISFLNNFFMGSITKLIYRAFTTAYLCLYGIILGYINRQKIKWPFVICGLVLLVCYFVSIMIAPKYYSYVIIGLTHRVEFYNFYIGTYSYITYGFSFLADIVSFVIFVSFVAPSLKSIKQLYPTLCCLVGIMVIACLYSLIKEHSQILQLLSGQSEYIVVVKSLFHSKNAFGLYLFVSSLASGFLLTTIKSRLKWVFTIPLFLFTMMSLFAMCKTSLLCCLFLDVLVIWYFAFFSKRVTFYISLSLTIVTILTMLGLIMIVTIPFLKEGTFSPVYNLLTKLFNGVFTRTARWEMAKYVTYGPFVAIGTNETNATFYLEIMSKVLQDTDISDFHSAYVTWYAHHGIVGSVIYGLLLCYIIYKIVRLYKSNKSTGFLLTIILASCLIFMIPESYVLFISISSYSFIINIITFCSFEVLTKKEMNKMEVENEK